MSAIANRPRVEPGWLSALCAILANVPSLPNAACRDHLALFDDAARFANPSVIQQCAAICSQCDELLKCRSWAQQQRELTGVFGGEYWPKARKRKHGKEIDNDHT